MWPNYSKTKTGAVYWNTVYMSVDNVRGWELSPLLWFRPPCYTVSPILLNTRPTLQSPPPSAVNYHLNHSVARFECNGTTFTEHWIWSKIIDALLRFMWQTCTCIEIPFCDYIYFVSLQLFQISVANLFNKLPYCIGV